MYMLWLLTLLKVLNLVAKSSTANFPSLQGCSRIQQVLDCTAALNVEPGNSKHPGQLSVYCSWKVEKEVSKDL